MSETQQERRWRESAEYWQREAERLQEVDGKLKATRWVLAWAILTALLTWLCDRSPGGAAIRSGVALLLAYLVRQEYRGPFHPRRRYELAVYLCALAVWLVLVWRTWNKFNLPPDHHDPVEEHYRE
jgi:hypothetical protein